MTRVAHVEAGNRQIFAKEAGLDVYRQAVLVAPESIVLRGVGIDGLVRAAVGVTIGLIVAGEIDAAHGDGTDDGVFPDAAGDRVAEPLDGALGADVDGHDASAPNGITIEVH